MAHLMCYVPVIQAAQLGIIFAAVSELATDQTIMQQLSDPNSNSQAYFIATAFLATAATFIPRFVGGEQPEDREQSVWTATAELANGRVRFFFVSSCKCGMGCIMCGDGVISQPVTRVWSADWSYVYAELCWMLFFCCRC